MAKTLTDAEPRDKSVMIRLSPREHTFLVRAAKQAGARSVSGYIREIALSSSKPSSAVKGSGVK